MDRVKKRHKNVESILKLKLAEVDRKNDELSRASVELDKSFVFLRGLHELRDKLDEAREQQQYLIDLVDSGKQLLDGMHFLGTEAEVDSSEEESETLSETESEAESKAESKAVSKAKSEDESSEDEDDKDSEHESEEDSEA